MSVANVVSAHTEGPIVVGLGELLWDLLPGGRQPGGAPANMLVHAAALGADARLVSAVGADQDGEALLRLLRSRGIDVELVAIDPEHPTGTVTVTLADGEPTYTIHEGVAWDFIPAGEAALDLISRADAVCFGTLARRSPRSRESVRTLLEATPAAAVRLLDVNLRQHYYDRELLRESLELASAVKLNEAETARVTELLGLPEPATTGIETLLDRFGLELVAVTRGSRGCALHTRVERACHAGFPADAGGDAVGAGDAFTAALLMGMLRRTPLDRIAADACRLAAWVCSHAGGMPELPESLRDRLAVAGRPEREVSP